MNKLMQEIEARLECAGDMSPGQYHLVADLIELAAIDASYHVFCYEDALLIPDRLAEAATLLRERARDYNQC